MARMTTQKKHHNGKRYSGWKYIGGLLVVICFLNFGNNAHAQQNKMDSLKKTLLTSKADTNQVLLLLTISSQFWTVDLDSFEVYGQKALALSQKLNYQKGKVLAYQKLGSAFLRKNDLVKALENFQFGLKISETEKNTALLALCNFNIAGVYYNQPDTNLAIKYYSIACDLYKNVNDKGREAACYNNLGNLTRDFTQALQYQKKALQIQGETNDLVGSGYTLNNIGILFCMNNNETEGLNYFIKALDVKEKTNDLMGMSGVIINIGSIYEDQNNFAQAKAYFEKGLTIAEQIGQAEWIRNANKNLSDLYKKNGMFEKSLFYLEKYISWKDTLLNENQQKQVLELEGKFQTEKKELQIENQKKEIDRKNLEVIQQQTEKIAYAVGFMLMLILAFVIFRGYRLKRTANLNITQQKKEVEKQKEIIEEKQKEILDSIRYAKRIQQSLLPTEKYIFKNLNRLRE